MPLTDEFTTVIALSMPGLYNLRTFEGLLHEESLTIKASASPFSLNAKQLPSEKLETINEVFRFKFTQRSDLRLLESLFLNSSKSTLPLGLNRKLSVPQNFLSHPVCKL